MIIEQLVYPWTAIYPQSVNNGSAIPSIVDTNGYGFANFILTNGLVAAAATVCKVQESDDMSTWGDITGAALTGSALPAAADSLKAYAIPVNLLGGRKRYLKLVYTSGAGANIISCVCALSRAGVQPSAGGVASISGFSGVSTLNTPV